MGSLERLEERISKIHSSEETVKKYAWDVAGGVTVGLVFAYILNNTERGNVSRFTFPPAVFGGMLGVDYVINSIRYCYHHYHKNQEKKEEALRRLKDKHYALFYGTAVASSTSTSLLW